jgi:hypothetical protein
MECKRLQAAVPVLSFTPAELDSVRLMLTEAAEPLLADAVQLQLATAEVFCRWGGVLWLQRTYTYTHTHTNTNTWVSKLPYDKNKTHNLFCKHINWVGTG